MPGEKKTYLSPGDVFQPFDGTINSINNASPMNIIDGGICLKFLLGSNLKEHLGETEVMREAEISERNAV